MLKSALRRLKIKIEGGEEGNIIKYKQNLSKIVGLRYKHEPSLLDDTLAALLAVSSSSSHISLSSPADAILG